MNIYTQFEANYRNILYDALEYTYECIVLTDPEGYIRYMNRPYQDFLEVRDVVGKHVTEVIENTRMHIVAKTAKPEIAAVQRIRGHDMIANRIPIIRDGRVLAVIGTVIFQDVQQLYALASTVDQLHKEVDYYKGELRRRSRRLPRVETDFDEIIGESSEMINLKATAARIAKHDVRVLITGESGTGKELLARAIHASSQRALGPFITVNCAAIPDSLLESELFGYESGSFTGASTSGKKGKFELADHGTLLLDEIGDMPPLLQSKLLRVLQEHEIERVGGTYPIPIDVRVIASTHRNLAELIDRKQFREDLFYRLNVIHLRIPPLRDRKEDIPHLVDQILKQLQKDTGVSVNSIEEGVWKKLTSHSWPGNVRELRNVLERAIYFMEHSVIRPDHITFPLSTAYDEKPASVDLEEWNSPTKSSGEPSDFDTSGNRLPASTPLTLRETLMETEKMIIHDALVSTHGDKRNAARLLGISKSALYKKLLDYKIQL